MAVSYQMRAFRVTTGAQGYVYWVSLNTPDSDGSIWEAQTPATGEPARNKTDLTQISINRSYQLVFPADSVSYGTIKLSQDLGGTAGDPKVVGLQGKAVDPTPPTANQGLIYDGTNWKSKTIDNTFVSSAISVGTNKVVTSGATGDLVGVDIPSGPANSYSVLMRKQDGTVAFEKLTQDMVGSAFSILSFNSTPSTSIEVGATLTDPSFTASYNKTPTSVKLTYNGSDTTLSSPYTSFSYTGSITKSSNGEQAVFTLSATDGVGTKTVTLPFTWGYRVYSGIGDSWASFNATQKSSFLTSISNNIQTSRNRTFTVNATTGKYIYYIYPASFGSGTFTTNLTGGFDLVDATYVISVNSINVIYYVYQSTRPDLGSQTVTVT